MPYVVMIDRLKTFLRNNGKPVALIVIGHSFSDEHINATVVESLRANPSAACYALQYGDLSDYPIATDLAREEPNLTVFGRNGAILRKRQRAWLPISTGQVQELQGAFKPIDTEDQNNSRRLEWMHGRQKMRMNVACVVLCWVISGPLVNSLKTSVGPVHQFLEAG